MHLGRSLRTILVLGLAFHIHHRFHGPPIDYGAVAIASVASWLGVPGPGEPVLIAAGVFAARHKLDITTVVVVAWLAATAGGAVGWWVGMKFGRGVLTTRGPFRRMRVNALKRGEEVFKRHAVVAIILTPSWIAGIHRVNARTYHLTNVITAAIWAVGIGLGAYFAGPVIIDAVSDVGTVTEIALALLVAAVLIHEIRRRRRRRRSIDASPAEEPPIGAPDAPV